MAEFYHRRLESGTAELPLPLKIAENDTVLSWWMALDMYRQIRDDLDAGRSSVFIVPVGPVYQYRHFITLVEQLPLDLSGLRLFFMDEYLDDADRLVPEDHPLSFRGFIRRELVDPLGGRFGFSVDAVRFPDASDPAAYDAELAGLGGPGVCYAGVGINGHLAFNEAPCTADAPSRLVDLTAETVTTNAHTALGGAYDALPRRAVTVGMKSILSAGRLSIWMNRPWQKAVVRKLLFGPVGPEFPASFARRHPAAQLAVTADVAEPPQFALR